MAQQSNPWAVVQSKPLAPNDPWAVVSQTTPPPQAPPPPRSFGRRLLDDTVEVAQAVTGIGDPTGQVRNKIAQEAGDVTFRMGKRLVSNVTSPIHSPIQTAKAVVTAPYQIIKSHMDEAQSAFDAFKRGDRTEGTLKSIASIIPVVGPMLDTWIQRTQAGEGPEVAADISMFAAPAALKMIPKSVKVGGKMASTNPSEAEALRYVQSQGVPANVAAVTGNDAIKGAMAAAEKTTLGGSYIGKRANAATEKGLSTLGEQLAAKAGRGQKTTMLAAGEEAASTLSGKVKSFGKSADAPYGKIRAAEAQGRVTGVNIAKFQEELRPVYDQLVRESKLVPPQGATAKALVAMDRLMQKQPNGAAPLSVADGALGELKAALRKVGESEPWSKGAGVLRKAVDELDQRVMETAKVHKLDLDLQAGRAATVAKYKVADVLDDLGTEPAATVQKLLSQKDRAVVQLRQIRQYAPEAVGEMGRAYLDDLFAQAEKAGGFNKTDKLFAEWSKLGPATKRELFADALKKNPDYLSNLDRFFLAAKKLSENPNPSGSGAMAANVAKAAFSGGAAVYNPKLLILAGMYEAGGAATAAALRSPRIARLLTRGLTVPMGATAKAAYLTTLAKAFESEGLPVPAFASNSEKKE